MKPLQLLMGTIEWAGKNFAHNLDYIPDDKLNWKPAPDSKSALEIASEVVGVVRGFTAFFQTGEFPMEFPTFESRDEAKAALIESTAKYAEFMGTLGPDDLGGEVVLPFATMPKIQVLGFPMIETIHHQGQVTYIQTMLGDKETHFFRGVVFVVISSELRFETES